MRAEKAKSGRGRQHTDHEMLLEKRDREGGCLPGAPHQPHHLHFHEVAWVLGYTSLALAFPFPSELVEGVPFLIINRPQESILLIRWKKTTANHLSAQLQGASEINNPPP